MARFHRTRIPSSGFSLPFPALVSDLDLPVTMFTARDEMKLA